MNKSRRKATPEASTKVLIPVTREVPLTWKADTQYGYITHGEWLEHEVKRSPLFQLQDGVLHLSLDKSHPFAKRHEALQKRLARDKAKRLKEKDNA